MREGLRYVSHDRKRESPKPYKRFRDMPQIVEDDK
jgi:hypothetical protein